MNKRQKEVLQAQVASEKAVMRKLRTVYSRAVAECSNKIAAFQADIALKQAALNNITDVTQRELLQSEIQSKIYQKQYQQAMKAQISTILGRMQSDQYDTIKEYIEDCYSEGFIGTVYDIHGQGIPFIAPIDQTQVVDAITKDTPLVKPLYQRLGYDVDKLKQAVNSEIARGIATGRTWQQIRDTIEARTHVPLYNAMRIARTEGHRVQQTAAQQAMKKAKDAGADVVKQWCSTLDDRTRPDHRLLDGQIRDVDDTFDVSTFKAQRPGSFGVAAQDINCRCCLLQRAKWALDEDELQALKDRAEFFGLDKSADFEDFKKKYLELPQKADTMPLDGEVNPITGELVTVLEKPCKTSDDKYYQTMLDGLEQTVKVTGNLKYNPVHMAASEKSELEIIEALCGGDRTMGSCASVGLAYIGQKQGWDVLDFRDGESQRFFAGAKNLFHLSMAKGIKAFHCSDVAGKTQVTLANNFLKLCEVGKEYYLCVGRHAAIVRKVEDGTLEYLELQSATRSGWTKFNGNPRYTLVNRFGCASSSRYSILYDFMMDIQDSDFDNEEFRSLLGYINTAENEQRKGLSGSIK